MTPADLLMRRFGVRPKSLKAMPVTLPKMGRRDLPALTKELGFTTGAEIGVWRGAFSALFCEANPNLHMLCVDPWQPHQAWLDTKNSMPKAEAEQFIEQSYRDAVARLAPLNATIVRKFSAEAAAEVPDRSLDFAYIDANHVYDAVIEDLTLWAPKVKSGGFIAGHDYRVFPNKPMIHVIPAVQAFTKLHKIAPWFVLASERTPSFFWEAA